MATDNGNVDIPGDESLEKESRLGRRGLFLVAGAIAVVAWLLLSGGQDEIVADSEVAEGASAQTESERERTSRQVRFGGPSREASIQALDNKLGEQERTIRALREELEKGDQATLEAVESVRRDVTAQLAEISEAVIDGAYDTALGQRNIGVTEAGGADAATVPVVPGEELDYPPATSGGNDVAVPTFEGELVNAVQERRRRRDDPFAGYSRLGSGRSPMVTGGADPAPRQAPGDVQPRNASFEGPPRLDREGNRAFVEGADNNDATNNSAEVAAMDGTSEGPSLLERARGRKDGKVAKTIPAISAVEITNLHGAACPVSGGGLGNLGSDGGVPVAFAVTGKFWGPDGKARDLGNAHILGICYGVDTPRPTAEVKIERLSYVTSDGEQNFVGLQGYLIDRRDNNAGIEGVKESMKGRQLAAYIAARTAEGLAEGFEENQIDETTAGGTGSVFSRIRQNRGDERAVASGASAGLEGIANYFAERANDSFEVIRFPAGLPINLVTITPTEYLVNEPTVSQAGENNVEPLL